MATTALETLIDQFEARLTAQIPTAVLLDRLDGPRESPGGKAHKGIRVWPAQTQILDQYGESGLVRVEDQIEIETLWRISRNADSSMDAALAFERSIIVALTTASWYDNPDGSAPTADRYEVHYSGTTREKDEGWLVLTITMRVMRDAEIGP